MQRLPDYALATTISWLTIIYRDKKMSKQTFKIIQPRRDNDHTEQVRGQLCVPYFVAFSEQYASSKKAANSLLGFICRFNVQSISMNSSAADLLVVRESTYRFHVYRLQLPLHQL